RWTHSLKWRIVFSYSLILILGGVSTSIIGIRVTGQALLQQAHQQVDHGLAAARSMYLNRLNELRLAVELLATSGDVRHALGENQPALAGEYLVTVPQVRRFDFLSVTDATGKIILRTAGPGNTGDSATELAPVARALAGEAAAATEIVPLQVLAREDPRLETRGKIELPPTPDAPTSQPSALDTAMVLLAAAPVVDDNGEPIAVIYAGRLLNEAADAPDEITDRLVDQIKDTFFPSVRHRGRNAGAATIFQDGVRISTNVTTAEGHRAVGTRVSRDVYEAVMVAGGTWSDLAFAVNDWYITAYEPITNLAGQRIGILGVGLLQRPYTAVRDSVTLAFAAIALLCFALIVVVTYFLTRSLVRPLEDMVAVSKEIAGGRLDQRVREVADHSELGVLSSSFNAMLDRIHDMNRQIEQWARVLEQKVEERTEQLAKTQAAMDRQQRLASLGQLAAGIAHEINNPLGGILTFATLMEEELPQDSPIRPDVEEVVRQADRCRRIVQELLEFSRQREARMAPHRLNDIVNRTLAILEKQASFHDINITRELDPDNPVAVVDDSQLQQVFMNIILNAADAMGERGNLAVTTGHDATNNEVFVRIADNGCGIPESMREAIFDPFFTTKDPGKGTGLGLAVAVRIVQTHGGRLELDSEVGQGSTFTVVLPTSGQRSDDAESGTPPTTL
ncbi:MAG: cache domain-containing protein, partial [Planctomycetes bacterium]|nr:cache domain-containing protein [Planctomycetota bacterium]